MISEELISCSPHNLLGLNRDKKRNNEKKRRCHYKCSCQGHKKHGIKNRHVDKLHERTDYRLADTGCSGRNPTANILLRYIIIGNDGRCDIASINLDRHIEN